MLYGFYNINSFITNSSSGVNPVGEMSEFSYTYSQNIERYLGLKGYLEIFDQGVLSGTQTTFLQQSCTAVAALLDNLVTYNTSSGTLIANMTAALGVTVSNILLGNPVLNPLDAQFYPQWISFTTTQNLQTYDFTIWLSDIAFQQQYPLGYFEFVYPMDNMQNLYYSFATSRTLINALSPTSLITKARTQVKHSVTGYDTLTVTVYDQTDQTQHIDVPILVAYNGGPIYNNQSAYLIALQNALISGGVLTLAQWLTVIPILVPVNKYYVVVNWGNSAINSPALPLPIGSPTIPVIAGDSFAAKYFPGYVVTDVTNFLDYSLAIYKSLGIYILPDLANPDGRIAFRTKFTDYFVVTPGDLNIQQMSPTTQNMSALLDQLIRYAETYVPGQPLLPAMTVVNVGIYSYICQAVDTTMLCVITRKSALGL